MTDDFNLLLLNLTRSILILLGSSYFLKKENTLTSFCMWVIMCIHLFSKKFFFLTKDKTSWNTQGCQEVGICDVTNWEILYFWDGAPFLPSRFPASMKWVAIAHCSASLFCEEHSWKAALPPGCYINVHQKYILPALMYLNPTTERTSVFRNSAYAKINRG